MARILNENTETVEGSYQFKILGIVNGKLVIKEGKNGTGKLLRFICGFCRDIGNNNLPTHAFRSRRERNRHANFCHGPIDSSKKRGV